MTRGERERRQQRQEDARRWDWETEQEDALPSELDGITPLGDFVNAPAPTCLYGRSSKGEQNFSPQLRWMKRLCEGHGIPVLASDGEHATGKSLDPSDRKVLFKLLEKACGGYIMVVDFTRFLRSAEFHPKNKPDARPSREELAELQQLADEYGVRFVTVNDPDATPEQGRAFIQKVNAECSKAGRPRKKSPGYMKRRYEEWIDEAKRLREKGLSLRKIVLELSKRCTIPPSYTTVRNWLNRKEPAGRR